MYAAAKHGVVGLVRSLGQRLVRGKIQVNGLAPCVVGTHLAQMKQITNRLPSA
jgi:NAD(P)-dependent dehydrogenase (short-subunit alcohol dehydrogenase family)